MRETLDKHTMRRRRVILYNLVQLNCRAQMAGLRFGSLSYNANTALANAMPAASLESLKSGQRRKPYRQRLTRRDVVVAVGGRPIVPVEQGFDSELDPLVCVDRAVPRRLEA